MKQIIAIVLLAFAINSCQKTITYKASDVPNDFVGLPPLSPDSGIQLHIEPFPVPANFEREFFIRKDLNNKEEIYVNAIRSVSRPGTHHFVLSTLSETPDFPLPVPNVIIDQNNIDGTFNLFSSVNRGSILFIAQSADYELRLPPGYGIKMEKDYKFLGNPHYFNKTNAMRFGEVYCNLYTIPKEKVTTLLELSEVSSQDFVLPANQETTITTDQIFDEKTQITSMSPHYHKLGKKFVVQIIGGPRNGEVILESYDYQHPVVGFFVNNPLILNKGEGLRTIVTYNNNTSRQVGYGVTSEDEMNYLFLYITKL
jgi:Copper type II ascorbate-dependent monooxygenase, C-terminal domain